MDKSKTSAIKSVQSVLPIVTPCGDRLPLIQTPRLLLRDIQVCDITPEYVQWLNDPQINSQLEIRFEEQTPAMVEAFIIDKLQDTVSNKQFGIYDDEGKTLIGTVTLSHINQDHNNACVSFVIGHKSAQNKGYATEAVHAVVHYAFTHCKVAKLMAGYYGGHEGSAKVLEKNGFAIEGQIIKRFIDHRGKRVDHIIVGLLAEDYLQRL